MPTLAESRTIQAGPYEITLEKEPDDFVVLLSWIHQGDSMVMVSLTLFQVNAPFKEYEAPRRLDTTDRPYFESLKMVTDWWAGQPAEAARWMGYPAITPAPVPEAARQPMYSSWYSFRQRLVATE